MIFKDRVDGGQELAARLTPYADHEDVSAGAAMSYATYLKEARIAYDWI